LLLWIEKDRAISASASFHPTQAIPNLVKSSSPLLKIHPDKAPQNQKANYMPEMLNSYYF
jgi:hypothetical protein